MQGARKANDGLLLSLFLGPLTVVAVLTPQNLRGTWTMAGGAGDAEVFSNYVKMPWGSQWAIKAASDNSMTIEVNDREYKAVSVGQDLVWNNGDLWKKGKVKSVKPMPVFSGWGASGEVVTLAPLECDGTSPCSQQCTTVDASVLSMCERSLGSGRVSVISGGLPASAQFSFQVGTSQFCVDRTDSTAGWSMNLQVLCELPPNVDFISLGTGFCRTKTGGSGSHGTASLDSIDACRQYCLEMAFCVGYEYTAGAQSCEIHWEALSYANEDDAGVCFTKYRTPNWHRWEAGLGPSGGSCTCPDGQSYQVGAVSNDCSALACEGGTPGQCGTNPTLAAHAEFKMTCNHGALAPTPWTTWQLGTAGHDAAYALALNGNGDVFLAGTMNRGGVFKERSSLKDVALSDLAVVKYTARGKLEWTLQKGTKGKDAARGLALDGTGSLFVAGCVAGSLEEQTHNGGIDAVLMKVTSNSDVQWTLQQGSGGDDCATAVALDAARNAVVVGYTSGKLNGQHHFGHWDAFVMKVNSFGSMIWTVQQGTNSWDEATAVAIDGAENIFVAGYTQKDENGLPTFSTFNDDWFKEHVVKGRRDFFLVKLDAGGNLLWKHHRGGEGSDEAKALALDSNGDAVVAGFTDGALDSQNHVGGFDMFVTKVSSNGDWLWTLQHGTPSDDAANAVAVNSAGDIFVAGTAMDSLDNQQQFGGHDLVLMKLNSGGKRLWTVQRGTSGDDEAMAVLVDSVGDVNMAGYTNGAMTDPSNWIGGSDLLFLKKNGDWCPMGEVQNVSFSIKADSGSCTGYAHYWASGIVAWDSGTPGLSIDQPKCEGLALAGYFGKESPKCTGFCTEVHELQTEIFVMYVVNLADLVVCLAAAALYAVLAAYKLIFGDFSRRVNIMVNLLIAVTTAVDGVLQLASLGLSIMSLPTVTTIHDAWCIDPTHPHGMNQFATLVKLEESLTFVLFIGVFELLLSFAAFYGSAKIVLQGKLDSPSNDKSPTSNSSVDNKSAWISRVTFWGVMVVGFIDAAAAGLDFFMFTTVAKEESDAFFSALTSDPYSWCLWPEVTRRSTSCEAVTTSAGHSMGLPSLHLLALLVAIAVTNAIMKR